MSVLDISILLFIVVESANVIILYIFPDSNIGNGVAVFNQWFRAKNDKSQELFAKYMVNWVAGTKLIFIVLLLVILFLGSEILKISAVLLMILSIATYFFRLHPIIKKMDEFGEITPKGYSKTLFFMITGFILMFCFALLGYLFI
ncbi:MAG: hypothetical protein R3Y09_05355 [Clostridia bacterium]